MLTIAKILSKYQQFLVIKKKNSLFYVFLISLNESERILLLYSLLEEVDVIRYDYQKFAAPSKFYRLIKTGKNSP